MLRCPPRVRVGAGVLVLTLGLSRTQPMAAQQPLAGSLVVFNAGSLSGVFRALLSALKQRNPSLDVRQESAGSLESVRKLTELGRVPDILAVADVSILPELVVPDYASWYATFARNALVLAYSDRSVGASEIGSENWWQVLLRPGVRTGRASPSLDPNGYRALMAIQLAERVYGVPGLADRLLRAMPERFVRPKAADLVALVQAGELDYAWSYRSMVMTTGLDYVPLPREVDLSDPGLSEMYRTASVRIPGVQYRGADSLTIVAEPIVYALTILDDAPNHRAAEAFVALLFSEEGQSILRAHGFTTVEHPLVAGPGTPPVGLIPPAAQPPPSSTP